MPKSIDVHFVKNEIAPTGLENSLFLLYLHHLPMHFTKQLGEVIIISHLLNTALNKKAPGSGHKILVSDSNKL